MKALRRLTVRAAFPPELVRLGAIVTNLRWSWHPDSRDLLESVDPELWTASDADPVKMFGEVSAQRLAAILAKDRRFLRRMNDVFDDLTDYLEQPRWYQTSAGRKPADQHRLLFTGIRHCRGATAVLRRARHPRRRSSQGSRVTSVYRIIGVGLLYRAGYFSQSLSRDGLAAGALPVPRPPGSALSSR